MSRKISPPPQPMEGLQETSPPPFLTKTYDMVDDTSCDHIVCWGREGNSFVVWDPHAFSTYLLPRFFKHSNFSSFVRQLNTYGFRKVDPDKWEFANEGFLRGRKHLLKNISRRKAPSQFSYSQQSLDPCLKIRRFGVDKDLDRLRHDKQILTTELVKMRQRQQNTRAQLQAMNMKLQGTERNQQQMMSFLARRMQTPEFIRQLLQQKGKRKDLEDVINKKRRRQVDQGESSQSDQEFNPDKSELLDFGDRSTYEVSELETLAFEMQGFGKAKEVKDELIDQFDSEEREIDDEVWEELINEKINEESSSIGDDEDVDVMASRLDHFEQALYRRFFR